MRFIYAALPLLSAVALAQQLTNECPQCPQVKCPSDDPVALCNCINNRETLCKQRCPKYKPQYKPCPIAPPKPSPTPSTLPTKPVTCECPLVNCLAIFPGGCLCANEAAQNCYDRCGGAPPKLQDCTVDPVITRDPEPEPAACECEQVFCIQSYPESCYCANAAATSCYQKCGGKKPELQTCPPLSTPSLTTKPTKTTKKPTPTPTPTKAPTTSNGKHKLCGGGRANYLTCDEGEACITDPYTPGCGPACDGLGICVKDKLCGGFAGFACPEKGQVCVDDPRDECDPKRGGADCGGLCVFPHDPISGQ